MKQTTIGKLGSLLVMALLIGFSLPLATFAASEEQSGGATAEKAAPAKAPKKVSPYTIARRRHEAEAGATEHTSQRVHGYTSLQPRHPRVR